jgi:hypothetical protein
VDKNDKTIVIDRTGEVCELPVSMQVYQAIYNDITGKTENITDTYNKYFELSMEDIFQLKDKIFQFCEQYHVEGQNHNITVYHIKATKERFSSFERFFTYNASNTSPIEKIVIEFNLLIVLPKVKKPQSYKIKIDLTSGIALLSKHENDFPKGIPINVIIKAIQAETAEVEIEYVDYIVARSISELIRDWIESLKTLDGSLQIKKLQDNSHHVREFFSFAFPFIAIFFCLKFSTIILSEFSVNEIRLSSFLIISFSAIFFSYNLGNILGRRIEGAIDSIKGINFSIIKINNGDKVLISEHSKKIRKSKIRAIKESVVAIILGFTASILANIISNIINSQP